MDGNNNGSVELRANAMIAELVSQRNAALDRCAALQADVAVLKARMAVLEARLAELEKPVEDAPR